MNKTEKKRNEKTENRSRRDSSNKPMSHVLHQCEAGRFTAILKGFKVDLETDQIQSELIIWWLRKCMMLKKKNRGDLIMHQTQRVLSRSPGRKQCSLLLWSQPFFFFFSVFSNRAQMSRCLTSSSFSSAVLIGNRDTKSTVTTTRDGAKRIEPVITAAEAPGKQLHMSPFIKSLRPAGTLVCLKPQHDELQAPVTLPDQSDHRVRYNSWIEAVHSGPKSLMELCLCFFCFKTIPNWSRKNDSYPIKCLISFLRMTK